MSDTLFDRLADAMDDVIYGERMSNVEHADDVLDVLRPELDELEQLRGKAADADRARALVADVRQIHGWAFTGTEDQHRERLSIVYGCLYELWAAEREGRAYVPLNQRNFR